ncbi:MAG: PorP/SprF family type IX secretion system membrane protein [Flavobacteriales bacterium]|nr:PorP/SprF family type IX secretion system membrane protein [Flavobacteriales bacterium]
MKTNINHFITLFLASVVVFCGYSQDIHFSQFYASPSTLNPATTGNFGGDYRVSGIYRRQWKATVNTSDDYVRNDGAITKPYTTYNLAVDLPLFIGDSKFGAGLMVFSDETGSVELNKQKFKIITTKTVGSISYLKNVNGHRISIGFQPALTVKQVEVDENGTGSGNGIKDGIYDSSIDYWRLMDDEFSDDALTSASGNTFNYFDFNAGAMWSKDFGKFEPVIGLAMFHIVNPKTSVLGDDTRLPNRNVASFGGTYELNREFFIMPNILFMTHKRVHDLVYGFNIGYNLDDIMLNGKVAFNYIYAGPQIRHSAQNVDALIFTIGANLKRWNIGLSRDITLSRLQSGTNSQHGTWEVSVIYVKPETLLEKKAIPCERY